MVGTPRHFATSDYPAEAGRVQLTVHFDVFRDEIGGCAVSFEAPEGSELVAKYGSKGTCAFSMPRGHRTRSRPSHRGVPRRRVGCEQSGGG